MHPDAPLRRITTWLAIFGYTLVASGLPLPLGVPVPERSPAADMRLASKDRSRPFPCMDKPCGCATAEQCFTNCCCNTPAQTLAWAKAHDVDMDVLASLERRVARAAAAPAKAAKPSCCSGKAPTTEDSCCSEKQPARDLVTLGLFDDEHICSDYQSLASLPAAAEDAADEEERTDDEPSYEPRSRTVTLRAMLACGGIVAEWFAAGGALPPPRTELCMATRAIDVCKPGDETGECLRASPASPPPRAA